MDFTPPRPARHASENIVPMINVVFLLLIFFLMTAQIAPPDPFEITPPEITATDGAPDGELVIYLAAERRSSFDGQSGQDALQAALARARGASVMIRADAGVDAARFANVLGQLSKAGALEIRLVTMEAAP